MKKQFFLIGVVAIVLVLFFGIRQIRSLQAKISQKNTNLAGLKTHLGGLKRLTESLALKKLKGGKLQEVPYFSEPQVNKALLEKFVQSSFSQIGLECQVKVGQEKVSPDFPSLVGIREIPLEIGVTNYSSYDQLIILLEYLKEYPFIIDLFTLGGKDVELPGKLKLKIKYYLPPGGS
ncbi:MAG TPA: hypothetical protein VMT04_09075 [Terriglobales bacterium]|nr:hypothetical protein [Terriglobales bacterium]